MATSQSNPHNPQIKSYDSGEDISHLDCAGGVLVNHSLVDQVQVALHHVVVGRVERRDQSVADTIGPGLGDIEVETEETCSIIRD